MNSRQPTLKGIFLLGHGANFRGMFLFRRWEGDVIFKFVALSRSRRRAFLCKKT